jgi:D-alanyl-D-alanine carboxypeptidase (penicillin-binding protein 5/6)
MENERVRSIIIFLAMAVYFNSSAANSSLGAEQAVLVDFETGDCLLEKNGEEKCAPSSMTKLMTLYVLFSAINSGRISLDDEYPVSKAAQKMKGSRSFFSAGSMVRIEDLVRSIIVHSGNDACVVVAEGLCGNVESFVEEMNKKAVEFGLKNTNFTNPSGLPEDDHFSCVCDMATIARRIIADFPQFYHYFSEKVFTINSITQQNRNTLLGNALKVDGLKTGRTNSGGYGVVVSAKNDGKRLIAVVNGCKSAKARARDANKLLALGFKECTPFKMIEAGKPISEIFVYSGIKDKVGLCTHEDVIVTIPRSYRKLLRVEIIVKEPADAPIMLGTKLGELVYKYGGATSRKYDLFAVEPVEIADFFQRAKIYLQRLIYGREDAKEITKIPIGLNIPQD